MLARLLVVGLGLAVFEFFDRGMVTIKDGAVRDEVKGVGDEFGVVQIVNLKEKGGKVEDENGNRE